jgi:hypothetical protein
MSVVNFEDYVEDFFEPNEQHYLGQQEHYLKVSVKELEKINNSISKLIVRKEELTDIIIGALEHNHSGQKSYEYGMYKIEVKTPTIYSLDKKRYESGEFKLPKQFNPIKESKSYSVDKKLCDKYLKEAPKDILDLLVQLIDEKPGKKNVIVTRRSK